MINMIKLTIITLLTIFTISSAQAKCFCACVDGANRPICDWKYEEVSASCGYKICTNGF